VTNQHRPLDAPRIQLRQDRASVEREAARRLAAGPIPGPVQRHDAQLARQPVSNLLPVRTRTWLAVQQHNLMPAHIRRA